MRRVEHLGERTMEHIKAHVNYPISKSEIIAECNNMAMHGTDYDAKDRGWLEQNLPDRTYNSADEVLSAIGMGGM